MKKTVGFLIAVMAVFGMVGIASANSFDSGTIFLNDTLGNGQTIDIPITITGISVPPDIINSATLTINASSVDGTKDMVVVDLSPDVTLGHLTGSTTIFTNLVSANVFQTMTNPDTLDLDISSGQGFIIWDNLTLVSYRLQIDYTVPDPPASVPEPCTMLLLGSGLVGVAAFRKFRKS